MSVSCSSVDAGHLISSVEISRSVRPPSSMLERAVAALERDGALLAVE